MTDQPQIVIESQDVSDVPPDAWRLPLSLRVLAVVFVLGGVWGATETLLGWIVLGQRGFNPCFVGLFIGWGLFRFQEGARVVSALLCSLSMAFAAAVGVSALVAVFFPTNYVNGDSTGGRVAPEVWLLTITPIAVALCIWWLKSLYRPEVDQRFRTPAWRRCAWTADGNAVQSGRFRFSLGTLLFAMAVTALVLVRVTADDVHYETRHFIVHWWSKYPATNGARVDRGVEYGVRRNRFRAGDESLVYAVLSSGAKWKEHVYWPGSCGGTYAQLLLPDGQRIALPGGHQLYELADGQVAMGEERVTVVELMNFVRLDPAQWNLDALVKHADAMRGEKSGLVPGEQAKK